MINNNITLKFGTGNAKLSKKISTFALVAGVTCPFAKDCLSCSNRLTGKIKDGPKCKFRCYAASIECTYPTVRASHWHNFDALRKCRTVEKMVNLINNSLPDTDYVRIHDSGDFYNERYFLAWLNVALNNPNIIFYAYTKALPFWVKHIKKIPSNFRLTASYGGTHDHLIKKHNLKSVTVVQSIKEAKKYNLEIDHDDSHAISGKNSFLIYLHGTQPAKSEAGKNLSALKKAGIFGYYKDRKSNKVNPLKKQAKIFINK